MVKTTVVRAVNSSHAEGNNVQNACEKNNRKTDSRIRTQVLEVLSQVR
jgi:hypothetical protein